MIMFLIPIMVIVICLDLDSNLDLLSVNALTREQ